MLQQLLELVQTGGTYRVADLARTLGTSPELVQAMLESLGRMGHLKAVDPNCAPSCGGCPIAGACEMRDPGKMWALAKA